MPLLVAYHSTRKSNRASIREIGLVSSKPAPFQRNGVYCFVPGMRTPALQRVDWSTGLGCDLWRVAYFGPSYPDPFVENGVVLPDVTDVTLVTGNE